MAAIIVKAKSYTEARERLRAVEPFAVGGASADDMTAGCLLLDVIEAGRIVGAVALDIEGEGKHRRATVTAATREGEMQAIEWQQIEAWARALGARRLRLVTRRPALVRNMIRRYGFAAAVLEKEL